MLDAFRPFLHCWNQLKPDNPLTDGIESGPRLLGAAFANVSKLRRVNLLRNVAPNLFPLLKDPHVFSSRESERHFSDKFIDAMVKEIDADDKMAKIGRSCGPPNNQYDEVSYRRNGNRNQSYNGSNGYTRGYVDKGYRKGFNGKSGQSASFDAKQHGQNYNNR